ncbi:hypothetical protein VTL71DRAFT_11972 [Oculimacula yallundae]|uniref:Fungal N-terminal domain-containing protein n=1 Tax=Oculimacula yallundae TaxID=86028 RepID=A0ABR4CRX7_9HELO
MQRFVNSSQQCGIGLRGYILQRTIARLQCAYRGCAVGEYGGVVFSMQFSISFDNDSSVRLSVIRRYEGLAASVIAITGAASAGMKLSRHMFKVAKQLKGAARDIEVFAQDMRLFQKSISFSLRSLNKLFAKLNPDSDLYQLLEREELLSDLAESSGRLEDRINEVRKHTTSMKGQRKLLTHIIWVFKKADVLSLRPDMESLKSSISIIQESIAIVYFTEQLKGDLPENFKQERREEIAERKERLGVEVQTISLLQRMEERVFNLEMQSAAGPRRPRAIPSHFLDTLKDLGSSMLDHEQVPGAMANVSQTSSTTNPSVRRRSYVSTTSTNTALSSPPPTNSETSIPLRGQTRRRLPTNKSFVNPSALPPEDKLHQRTPTQPEQVAIPPTSRRKQRQAASTSQPTPRSLVPNIEAAVASSSQPPKVLSKAPSTEFLQFLNVRENMPQISGYMVSNWNRIFHKATPDPGCPHNLISASQVASLGLTVEPHDNPGGDRSHPVVITFPGGLEVKSCGVVALQWSHVIHSSMPTLDVRCIVFENLIREFIPGRPFVDDLQRHWGAKEWLQ